MTTHTVIMLSNGVMLGHIFDVMSRFSLLLITIFIMKYLFLAYFISYQNPP